MVRFKNRYVLAQVVSDKKSKFTPSELADTIRKSVSKFYGDFGQASIANLNVRLIYEKHKLIIIRISHGAHHFVSSSLPLINKIGKDLAKLKIIYIGATIRQCKKFIISHGNNELRKIIGSFNDESERRVFNEEVTNALEN